MLKVYALIVVLGLVGGVGYGGYYYYKDTQQRIKTLTENNAKLTADLNLANEKFNKVNASGERRDIGNLAVSKPKSIERIERKREQQRARCFEIAQGSPLTEEEINATKKSQINAECTNIANPNYVPY